jgi:drug/metabolite transporter (DMT)-like permease
MTARPPTVKAARLALVAAAVLWSTSSGFVRLLRDPSALGLNDPPLTPLQVAVFRGLFAGLAFVPLLRRADVRVRPRMLLMVGCFGLMSGLYLSALSLGPAANAILLQNTAPFWVYLIGVYLLGEPADRWNWRAILLAMAGAAVMVTGNWPRGLPPDESAAQSRVLLMACGSGVAYAGVILFLRSLRAESSVWLTVWNLIGSACLLLGFITLTRGQAATMEMLSAPTARQLAFLAVFGVVQMALPYLLFAYGLRTVGPQEAGLITLLEPVLNPVWAYLLSPDTDTPTMWTAAGGAVLLAALGWRYRPRRS